MPFKIRLLTLPLLMLLAIAVAGCGQPHHDLIHDNSPDKLPVRLQLPPNGSSEGVRIVRYAPDNMTRREENATLRTGTYAGGREVKIFDANNQLASIFKYYQSVPGSPDRLGYMATFGDGQYLTEQTFSPSGARVTDGHQLIDGTFEQTWFYSGGLVTYKHAIFGRLMNDQNQLHWKGLSDEIYREDRSLAVVDQQMDDGYCQSQFFDEHNKLTEILYRNDSGTAVSEIDYQPDGKTPQVRYDFGSKVVWTFDKSGLLASKRNWFYDGSQQLTVYKGGKPFFEQDWEVDQEKSSKSVVALRLSWVEEDRPDGSQVRTIRFWDGAEKLVQTIEVPEAPPKGANVQAPNGPTSYSSTPVKAWAPTPSPSPSPPPAASASAAAGSPAPTIVPSPSASPFWTPSGARTVYTYSKNGYLIKVELFGGGTDKLVKSTQFSENARIKPQLDPSFLRSLPQAGSFPAKAKDLTPKWSPPTADGDFGF